MFSKKSLGIDIGASSIKVVEVSSFGKKKKLENYFEFMVPSDNKAIKTFQSDNFSLMSEDVAALISALFRKMKIKQKKVAFAIPDFSTFFTTFTLPPMTEEEVPRAIEFEARHHIPLPLSEVVFDWQVVGRKETLPGVKLKILLVAVPNKVLESYQRLASICGLEAQGMEAEVFGLMRSVVAENQIKKTVCLVDFGWQSTTVSIVENKSLKISQSFDISGTSLTKDLSIGLSIDMKEAEKLKKEHGLDPQKEEVYKILLSSIGSLAADIENVCQNYSQNEGRTVEDIILAGGTSLLNGLKDYLSSRTRKNVYLADPFSTISAPAILKNRLQELGPSFAVALGVAMMGSEA